MQISFPIQSAFLALPLEDSAKNHFGTLRQTLEPYTDFLKLQQEDTPHLTLAYWQEIQAQEYESVTQEIQQIAHQTSPFSLSIKSLGTFEEEGNKTVLFLKPQPSDALLKLKQKCPWPQKYPFSPHITLAYIQDSNRFVQKKEEIWNVLRIINFTVHNKMLRLYGYINGHTQTPIEDFEMGNTV